MKNSTMSHLDYTTKSKKGQHLSYEERQKIEILLKAGHKAEEIGQLLGGRSKRTIQQEISFGKVQLLNSDLTFRTEYSADAAQRKRDYRQHRTIFVRCCLKLFDFFI